MFSLHHWLATFLANGGILWRLAAKASGRGVNISSALSQIRRVLLLIIHHSSVCWFQRSQKSEKRKSVHASLNSDRLFTRCNNNQLDVGECAQRSGSVYLNQSIMQWKTLTALIKHLGTLIFWVVCQHNMSVFNSKAISRIIGECRILLWANNRSFVCQVLIIF